MINLYSWSLSPSQGRAPKGAPEFICATEITVPKLLQFNRKVFWPWAPCWLHWAAVTVQSWSWRKRSQITSGFIQQNSSLSTICLLCIWNCKGFIFWIEGPVWKTAEAILLLCNLEEGKKLPKPNTKNPNKNKPYSQVSSWKQDKGGKKTKQTCCLGWVISFNNNRRATISILTGKRKQLAKVSHTIFSLPLPGLRQEWQPCPKIERVAC